MITQVSDTIYLGDWQDASRVNKTLNDGRTLIIMTCAFDSPFNGDFIFPLVDGPADNNIKVFLEAVAKLKQLQDGKWVTLVHCCSGESRSISVVIKYLMDTQHIDFDTALKIIEEKRPTSIKPFFSDYLRKGWSDDV